MFYFPSCLQENKQIECSNASSYISYISNNSFFFFFSVMSQFGPQFSWTEQRNCNKKCFNWGLISAKWSGRASPVFFFRWHAKEELLILSQRQSESWLCQRQLYYTVVSSAEIWFLASSTNTKIPKENQKDSAPLVIISVVTVAIWQFLETSINPLLQLTLTLDTLTHDREVVHHPNLPFLLWKVGYLDENQKLI